MSEKNYKIQEVEKAMARNAEDTKTWNLNAITCEVSIKTYEKHILKLERLHKDKLNKIKLQTDRAVKNARISHDNIDRLIEEKEVLHQQLKAAIHLGEKQCEWCLKYFTPQGFTRHKNTCSMKPEVKMVKEHETEIKEDRSDLEARKAALQKELDKLEKIAKG